jgi:hypothetical protein
MATRESSERTARYIRAQSLDTACRFAAKLALLGQNFRIIPVTPEFG